MDRDMEKMLRRADFNEVPESLDRKVHELLDGTSGGRRLVPVWIAVAACLLCGTAGFMMRSVMARPEAAPVREIRTVGEENEQFFERQHGEVRVVWQYPARREI